MRVGRCNLLIVCFVAWTAVSQRSSGWSRLPWDNVAGDIETGQARSMSKVFGLTMRAVDA
jgi:hypothetical protein